MLFKSHPLLHASNMFFFYLLGLLRRAAVKKIAMVTDLQPRRACPTPLSPLRGESGAPPQPLTLPCHIHSCTRQAIFSVLGSVAGEGGEVGREGLVQNQRPTWATLPKSCTINSVQSDSDWTEWWYNFFRAHFLQEQVHVCVACVWAEEVCAAVDTYKLALFCFQGSGHSLANTDRRLELTW